MSIHQTFAPTASEIDRLLWHMRTVASTSESEWAAGFAMSMLRNAKRRGWTPTPKQFGMMNRLVSEMFTCNGADTDGEVLE